MTFSYQLKILSPMGSKETSSLPFETLLIMRYGMKDALIKLVHWSNFFDQYHNSFVIFLGVSFMSVSVKPAVKVNKTFSLKTVSPVVHGLVALSLCGSVGVSIAGADVPIGDNAGINIGMGLRSSYTNATNSAPDGISRSNKFSADNARIFLSGHFGDTIKATFNTERTGGTAASGGDAVRVMDAIMQFEFSPEFNIWMGRMLPPSDRANLYGPFYSLAWSFPGLASNYPNIGVGRDNGLTVWGKPLGGKITYSLGAFNGHDKSSTLGGAKDKLAFSGRLAFNVWDPEPAPAYYTGGWYGGSKDIFTIGLATYSQTAGVGTAAKPGNLNIVSGDLLIEKKFSGGVPTFEAASYGYRLGAKDCGTGTDYSGTTCPSGVDNVGGQVDSKSYLFSFGFLFDQKVGIGQLQPYVRYQNLKRTASNTTANQTDFGINYLMKGPNAKVSATYTTTKDTGLAANAQSQNQFVLGVQLMY